MANATSPFRIYNASAGSGKTYTLTREYLLLLLSQYRSQPYRRILAITFTNKAVGELKSRILDTLEGFSRDMALEDGSDMFRGICQALEIDPVELQKRSAGLLQEILHNYAFFDVSTIDKFNHRILRTFSRDLELPAGFEVITDTDSLLRRAVDALVQKAGSDAMLTSVMLEFALEKTEEDRHWDLSLDLFDMGKSLFNENDLPYLEIFRGKSIHDFLALRKVLDQNAMACENQAVAAAQELQGLIAEQGLETTDFYGGYFPKFLQKIVEKDLRTKLLEPAWLRDFGETIPFKKSTSDVKKAIMEALHPAFVEGVDTIRTQLYQRDFLINARKNLAPFTLLGLLRQELDRIQEDERLLPVAHFNAIIAGELAEQPAAYIYERLGEKYRYYFIDEFQDTSLLQWQNLIPLISNALSGEDESGRQGGLILVGDAKQAIYRWRGGRAEQFMGLSNQTSNPFPVPAQIEPLPKNYRSCKTLVDFNNELFTYLGAGLIRDTHAKLFLESSRQEGYSDETGLVSLEFLEGDTSDMDRLYTQRTIEILKELQLTGYPWRDICILTRRRKEGVLVSQDLAEAGIPMVSSETLLLDNHPAVRFLIALLRHLRDPADPNPPFDLLYYLLPEDEDPHDWIDKHRWNIQKLFEDQYGFKPQDAAVLPVYDLLEMAVAAFELGEDAEAYLIFLLDLALEVGISGDQSIGTFLEHWELKKTEASLKAPENQNAVRLMTIHQAKGLEFPVVIYPFADSPMAGYRSGKLWVPVPEDQYGGFSYLQISKRKEALHYGTHAADRYREELENSQLDALNILYVAHTRAEKALFVVSRAPGKTSAAGTYADWYQGYLKERGDWDPEQSCYRFGALPPADDRDTLPMAKALPFRTTGKAGLPLYMATRSGREWASGAGEAMALGNLVHYAMSLIETRGDLPEAMQRLLREGAIRDGQREAIEQRIIMILEHPELTHYFDPGWMVYNEREILMRKAVFLRPDRLQVKGQSAVIIDYKTGQARPEHLGQLREYRQGVNQMGLQVERAILVYIKQEQITLEEL